MFLQPLICGAFICFAACNLVFADALVTDRPDFTESTSVVPLHVLQVEMGYTYGHTGSAKSHSFGELLCRAGAMDNVEWRIEVGSYLVDNSSGSWQQGFNDPALGLKWGLWSGVPTFLGSMNTAVIGMLTLPLGSPAFSESKISPEVKWCMDWDTGPAFGLASNLNYAYPSSGGVSFSQFSWSLSASYEFSDRWGGYLEYYTFRPTKPTGDSSNILNTGLTYLLSNTTQLDARAGVGLDGASPDYFAGVGYSVLYQ